jgi:hypothetical protein
MPAIIQNVHTIDAARVNRTTPTYYTRITVVIFQYLYSRDRIRT